MIPSSGLLEYMLGAKNNKRAPNIIMANPPLFLDLLCSLCAIFQMYSDNVFATCLLPMSEISGPILGPLDVPSII